MKHKLYEQAKASVLYHCEISDDVLITSNKEDVVDARCLLVCVLARCGMKDADIAELTSLTRPCVCKLRNSFSMRETRMFSILWKRICSDVDMNMKQADNEVL